MTAGDYGAMRASDADRNRIQARLNDAYAEGRLTKEDWDERAAALASAKTYSELDRLTSDLPRPFAPPVVAPFPPQPYQQQTNGMAVAALVCGVGQLFFWFPASIAAVILGHKAKRQIQMTGEQGYGMAQAGLVLGYIGLSLLAFLVVAIALLGISSTSFHHP